VVLRDLADRSATELRRLIAAREASAVDVLEACLERIEGLNGTINAVVTLNPRAMDDARELDRRLAQGDDPGTLCGLPVGIKDVTPVASLRTTFGSPLYADFVPEQDALVVRRLRDAGAIILGKTNCPEFAAGGNTFNEVFGRTRNPWDTSKSAGGSTGGGAAALAAGMIALAEGTDLGGSLRIPASFCGIVGVRPTVGLVPTHPTDWVWDTLQVTGPMGRTAEDVALMLQAIAGPSEWSPASHPPPGQDYVAAVHAGPRAGVRIAYCSDPARIGIDAAIERVCRDAAFGLSANGAVIEDIDLDLSRARSAFLALRGLWFVTHMQPHFERARVAEARGVGGAGGGGFGSNVSNNVRAGLETTTADLATAEHERGRVWHRFRELFARFDHVVTPCMAVSPFPVEQNYPDAIAGRKMQSYVDWIAPTFLLSLTGLPVSSVPCGLDETGMPVGLQLVGRPHDEGAVLALAAAIQRARPIGLPRVV
jgi:amidase